MRVTLFTALCLFAKVVFIHCSARTAEHDILAAVQELILDTYHHNYNISQYHTSGHISGGQLPQPKMQQKFRQMPLNFVPDNNLVYPAMPAPLPSAGGQYQQYVVGSPGSDPCRLPQQIGTGPYRIPRWYYNPARMCCEMFYWSGCCGNGNNFNSYPACQQACEVKQPNTVVYVPFTLTFTMRPGQTAGGGPSPLPPPPSGGPVPPPIGGGTQPLPTALPPATSPQVIGPITPQAPPNSVGPAGHISGAAGGPPQPLRPPPPPPPPSAQPTIDGNALPEVLPTGTQFRPRILPSPAAVLPPVLPPMPQESPNPCAYGATNQIQCGAGSVLSSTCTGQQFCHVGASPTTTVCCNKPANIDRCLQPLNIGIGNANLQRWYFNPATQQCQTAVYKGLQGNENNFLSRSDCEMSCQPNPCARGIPYRNGGAIAYCSANNQAACPAGYYCHIGADASTSVCCQALGGDPCGQPMSRGRGNAQLSRWYWDQNRQCCQPFNYCGQKGTQNNFLTRQDCERTCYVPQNPCSLPIQPPLQQCVPGPASCGAGQYCHVGANPLTTVCCPLEGPDPCLLPVSRGAGNAGLQRWAYNPGNGQCLPFTYCGLKGNANNFLTKEECDLICQPNPCAEGRPFIGADGRPQTCSVSIGMNTCPANHWCHIGADLATTVCCPNARPNPCSLPMSTGEGLANLERYYFDQATKSCKPFLYKGLKGNQNNFVSLRACELACQPLDNPCIGQPATSPSGQVLFCSETNKDTCPVNFWCHLGATPETTVCCPGATNPCSVPLAPGTGNAGIQRWYYNPDDRQCIPFQYNGKRGNQNNFVTQAECERTCPEQLCLLSIDRGACSGRQTRYAFNRQTGQCVPFEYTGCGGNLNNFQTMADCIATCGNVGF